MASILPGTCHRGTEALHVPITWSILCNAVRSKMYIFAYYACFMWYTCIFSSNRDQSGPEEEFPTDQSVWHHNGHSLFMTSQWVMRLLEMSIVKSQWVIMLLGISIMTLQLVITLLCVHIRASQYIMSLLWTFSIMYSLRYA